MNKAIWLAAMAATITTGCASTGSSEPQASGGDRDDCFYLRTINGFDAIDDEHLWVDGVGDDQFLLTMAFRCNGIRFANAIALADRMGRMCPGSFGRIVYRDAGMRRECRIDDVQAVSSKDEAKAIVEARNQDEDN